MTLVESSILRVVRCGIGKQTFALELDQVRGIQRADRLRAEEDSGTPLVGWLPHRGEEIPVYRLGELLGCEGGTATPDYEHILVVDVGGAIWGLLVDHVSQVTHIDSDHVQTLPQSVADPLSACFHGAVEYDGTIHLLLAPERLNPDLPPMPLPARFHAKTPKGLAPIRADAAGRLVLFGLHDAVEGERPILCGLPISQVAEILEPPPLVPVPGAPEFALGVTLWRSVVVPVIDLAVRLGLPPVEVDSRSRLLVLRWGDDHQLIGVMVRPHMRVLRLPIAHEASHRELSLEPGTAHPPVELKYETLMMPILERVLDL